MIIRTRYNGPQFWDGGKSLDLYFARDKSLDPRITFTRASSGTYWDENSVLQTATTDEPRFTHNPATGESLGRLIEGAATNLLTYSEDFSNAAWYKIEATISANQLIAPDGTLGFDALIENTANDQHLVYETLAAPSIGTYTLSAVVSKTFIGSRNFYLRPFSTGGVGGTAANGVIFDQDGEFVAFMGGGVAPTYEVVDEGDRFVVSVTGYTVNVAAAYPSMGLADGTTVSYTGNGTSAMYLWGAQFEAGSKRTSYIKTEASTVTRAADVPVMTGANFSDWFNQAEGALVIEYLIDSVAGSTKYALALDGGASNYIELAGANSSSKAILYSRQSGTLDVSITSSANVNVGTVNKAAFSYKANDYSLALNGAIQGTDTTNVVPVVTSLEIGRYNEGSPGGYLNGTIKRLTYYPRRLTNGNLQELTS